MSEVRICPECGEDFGSWPDGANYCSAECVVHRIRMQARAKRLAAEGGDRP